MARSKKNLYFKPVRCLPAWKWALLSLLFLLLIPANLFQRGGHWIELVKRAEGKAAYEILKVYSILKSNRSNMSEASAWAITETILEESKKHSLDPMLVLAVIKVESRFHESAISTEGARGLMQIRPFVANALAEEVELTKWEGESSLDDPILNIKLGVFYLSHLKKRFRDLKLALAAYNWGPTEIRSRLEGEEEVPLGYAMKVLSAYYVYRSDSRQTN